MGRLVAFWEGCSPVRIEVTAAPSLGDQDVILTGLLLFNRERTGTGGMPVAVLVSDRIGGPVLGGLVGHTFAEWLFVEVLWLPEELRGCGLGARVLAQAEAEAVRRGCIGAHLDTFSFQAPGFYQRLGYAVFGVIDDYPPGHQRLFLRKRLAGAATDAVAG